MSSRPIQFWQRKAIPLGGCIVLGVGIWLGVRQWQKPAVKPPSSPPLSQSYPGVDLDNTAATFETLRYTADTGGNENTRAQAIVWLDEHTRTMQPLSPHQEAWMLDMLKSGGHPQWQKEYKFWVFNCAFNSLHACPRQEDLTRLLQHLAVHDPEKTMRLYALQHLESQRTAGRLTGPLADKVRTILTQIASAPDGLESGLAIRLLAQWNGVGTPVHADVVAQALKLAADDSRPEDIRVTALHACGASAIDVARNLAADAIQPIFIRLAAIGLIGSHGGESDLTQLQQFSEENFRLGQAAGPAIETIRRRLAHPNAPVPVPF